MEQTNETKRQYLLSDTLYNWFSHGNFMGNQNDGNVSDKTLPNFIDDNLDISCLSCYSDPCCYVPFFASYDADGDLVDYDFNALNRLNNTTEILVKAGTNTLSTFPILWNPFPCSFKVVINGTSPKIVDCDLQDNINLSLLTKPYLFSEPNKVKYYNVNVDSLVPFIEHPISSIIYSAGQTTYQTNVRFSFYFDVDYHTGQNLLTNVPNIIFKGSLQIGGESFLFEQTVGSLYNNEEIPNHPLKVYTKRLIQDGRTYSTLLSRSNIISDIDSDYYNLENISIEISPINSYNDIENCDLGYYYTAIQPSFFFESSNFRIWLCDGYELEQVLCDDDYLVYSGPKGLQSPLITIDGVKYVEDETIVDSEILNSTFETNNYSTLLGESIYGNSMLNPLIKRSIIMDCDCTTDFCISHIIFEIVACYGGCTMLGGDVVNLTTLYEWDDNVEISAFVRFMRDDVEVATFKKILATPKTSSIKRTLIGTGSSSEYHYNLQLNCDDELRLDDFTLINQVEPNETDEYYYDFSDANILITMYNLSTPLILPNDRVYKKWDEHENIQINLPNFAWTDHNKCVVACCDGEDAHPTYGCQSYGYPYNITVTNEGIENVGGLYILDQCSVPEDAPSLRTYVYEEPTRGLPYLNNFYSIIPSSTEPGELFCYNAGYTNPETAQCDYGYLHWITLRYYDGYLMLEVWGLGDSTWYYESDTYIIIEQFIFKKYFGDECIEPGNHSLALDPESYGYWRKNNFTGLYGDFISLSGWSTYGNAIVTIPSELE